MSRNLGRRDCARCGGNVALVGGRRPIEHGEARGYFDEYKSLVVANAECQLCGARYLAWMEWGDRRGDPGVGPTDRAYFDLSYRSTFNDEPGPEDLPPRCPGLCAQCKEMKRLAIEEGKIGFMLCETCAACPVCRPPAPASGHPAPWRWVNDDEDEVHPGLFAANGEPVLDYDRAPWTERSGELIRAAPEMEDLIRKMVLIYYDVQKFIRLTGIISGYPLGIGIVEEARALLVRIDAASEPRQPR